MSRLGEIADKYYCVDLLRRNYFRVVRLPRYIDTLRGIHRRRRGTVDALYAPFVRLRDTHRGERCFIIGTGPSLTFSDLELLRGEITFGVNSISKILSQTVWRPTYYGIQDPLVYAKLEESIVSQFTDNVFVADILDRKFTIPRSFIRFPYTTYYHLYSRKKKGTTTRFTDDAAVVVYDGSSITHSLLQIAVFMGFTHIYLLGCDCNYPTSGPKHFVESGFVDRNAHKNHDKMSAAFAIAYDYASQHGISLVNCTRGGMLDVLPRQSLEEVLSRPL